MDDFFGFHNLTDLFDIWFVLEIIYYHSTKTFHLTFTMKLKCLILYIVALGNCYLAVIFFVSCGIFEIVYVQAKPITVH